MSFKEQRTDAKPSHAPVMLREVVEILRPHQGGVYVDGSFGGGGHASALLDCADCVLVGVDRDAETLEEARALEKKYDGRLKLIQGRFGELLERIHEMGFQKVDGITLDVGISSLQLDSPERGFSFQKDAPLDMRMDRRGTSMTAAQWIAKLDEASLARILSAYGEERRAKSIARAIVQRRKTKPITRTADFANLVARIVGRSGKIHPATRSFQAMRILVNNELEEIAKGLSAAERLLHKGGRLAVITFHSLEDRIVKHFLASRAGRAPNPSRHMPPAPEAKAPSFDLIGRGVVKPPLAEIKNNPRARSAKLRAAERNGNPAHSDSSLEFFPRPLQSVAC